jgi:hypothetical protein
MTMTDDQEQDETMAADVRTGDDRNGQNAQNEHQPIDSDDTTAAPEPDDPETAIVAADTTAAPELAWSAGEEPTTVIERRSWSHTWKVTGGIVAGSALLAIGVYVAVNGHHDADLHVSALPVTVHPTVAAVQPPAPPVTTTVTPALPVSATDQLFLDYMTSHGWTGSSAQAIQSGYRACVIIAPGNLNGYYSAMQLAAETGLPFDTTKEIMRDALTFYCPQRTGSNPSATTATAVPSETARPVPTFTAAQDQEVLTKLSGYTSTRWLAQNDPELVIREAHQYCHLALQTDEKVEQLNADIAAETGWDISTAGFVTSTATSTYPIC